MIKDVVSIIVPVYNVEKYIKRCVDSIFRQTYPNWELILVDDGSTDGSGNICDELAVLSNKVIVYHQNNQGVSAARRNGLKHCSGRWVMFVDGDDRITPDAIESLIKPSTGKNYDIIIGAFKDEFASGRSRVRKQKVTGVLDYNKYSLAVTDYKIYMSSQGRLYRSSLLKESNIIIDRVITNNEDFLFNFFLLPKVKTVLIIPKVVYLVSHREGSASRRKYSFDYWYSYFIYVEKNYGNYSLPTALYYRNKLLKIFSLVRSDKNYNIDLNHEVFNDVRFLNYNFCYNLEHNIALYLLKHSGSRFIKLLRLHPRHLFK